MALFLALLLLGAIALWQNRDRWYQPPQKRTSRAIRRPPSRPRPKQQKPRIPPHLARELMALTRDQGTANRLVSHIARQNPGRSPAWCAERAIADLIRDRRR